MGTKETIIMFFKVLVFLPFIIFLIYLLFKYGGTRLQEMQNGKYMKILDRMPLSKDNSLLIVKIGQNAYIISSAQGRVEILKQLTEAELYEIEKNNYVPQYNSIKDIMIKLKDKKEDKL